MLRSRESEILESQNCESEILERSESELESDILPPTPQPWAFRFSNPFYFVCMKVRHRFCFELRVIDLWKRWHIGLLNADARYPVSQNYSELRELLFVINTEMTVHQTH